MRSRPDLLTPIAKSYIEVVNLERKSVNLPPSEMDFQVNEKTGEIKFIIPEKEIVQDSGRRSGARKVPTNVLIKWMKKSGITTENNKVFAIQQAIFKNGIRAKRYLEKSKESANEIVNEILSIDLSELLTEKIKEV